MSFHVWQNDFIVIKVIIQSNNDNNKYNNYNYNYWIILYQLAQKKRKKENLTLKVDFLENFVSENRHTSK